MNSIQKQKLSEKPQVKPRPRTSHGWARRIPATLASLLLGVVAGTAQTPVGLGHVDIGIAFEQGAWDLHIHDETIDQEYEPNGVMLVVRHAARTTIPSDARFAFLGTPGAPLWLLPQVENENLLFLGLAAEEIPDGVFVGNRVKMTLKQVQGPGHLFVYGTGGVTGDPVVRMNSRDGLSDASDFADVLTGGHTDYNWAFTAPGTYTVMFEATGTLVTGNQAVASGPIPYTFIVEPEPGAAGDILGFYVGQDALPLVRFGTYAGLLNPNQGRLLFLYGHVFADNILNNHYHAIGAYEYSGPTNAPVTIQTNANNRIPETFTSQAPITLTPGTGRYEGKLASAKTAEPYSDLRFRSVHTLRRQITLTATNEFGFGSPQHTLFNSNLGGRTGLLDGVVVAMELVSKSDGLHVGTPFQTDVLSKPGDRVVLGDGNRFEFLPVAWTEVDAPAGHYFYRFKLVDVNTEPGHQVVPESGIVTFDFQVAPPPILNIAETVTLTLPLATDGYVLESGPTVNGPWTVMNAPFQTVVEGEGEAAHPTGKTVTVPLVEQAQFFRLRKQ